MSTIFIVSNAVSGDMQGAHLARKLREVDPGIRLVGSGGERMREAGVDVRIKSDHLACVGIIASLRFLGDMQRALDQQKEIIRAERPNLAILLDNEGTFNEKLAAFLKNEGIPIIHYFPPLVWLWGAWRAKKIARNAHAIISAFPNEVSIYKKAGGRAFYFGHPLVDVVEISVKNHPITSPPGKSPLIGLMPGSRVHEVEMLTAPMLEAARLLQEKHPDIQFILPVAASFVRPILEREITRMDMGSSIRLVEDREYESIRSCSAVIVAAGTATIELALLKMPMLVVYKLGPVTYEFVRRLIKTPFIAMPNILLGRRVVPELQQQGVTPAAMATEVDRLLCDTSYRHEIIRGLEEAAAILGPSGVLTRVADFVVSEAASLNHFLQLPVRTYAAPMTPRPVGSFLQRWKQRALNSIAWLWAPIDAAIWFILERLSARYKREPETIAPIRWIGEMVIRGARHSTREKMKLVLGENRSVEEIDQMMISYADERGLGLAEPIIFSGCPALGRDLITIQGENLLKEALSQKKGVMFLLSHLGPMTCVPAAFGPRGYDITFTGTPMHRPYYELKMREMLKTGRTYRGVIGDDLPRLARQAFSRNGIFTAFIDYAVANRHCVQVPVGHAETSVSLAPAMIALRYKVPIFFVRCERKTPTAFQVELISLPPLTDETLSIHARAEDLTRRAFALFNKDLVRRPSGWWVWDFAQIHPRTTLPASTQIDSRPISYSHV